MVSGANLSGLPDTEYNKHFMNQFESKLLIQKHPDKLSAKKPACFSKHTVLAI